MAIPSEEISYQIYTGKQNADKAISILKGILLGINLDNEINEKEVKELNKWVDSLAHLINRNPFNEFMAVIKEALSAGIPTKEAIEDLFWLCQKYEGDSYYYNAVTSDLQILQGLCHGILADGVMSEKEVIDLNTWLEENEHLNTYYPYDEIRSLLLTILADHKVDENEKLVLKAFINQFVSIKDKDIRSQLKSELVDVKIMALCTSEPQVTFEGKTFCITGVLKRGNRADLQRELIKLGAIPTDNLIKTTDYLIVGDNGNQAWTFACYGRKVEKALQMRKEGHNIMIIHEFDFCDILDDLI
ncbi:MAG TPA: BRCT domain-containing protein [Bacteroidia bacterium]|jgi:NAD-dependent DNA ligase